MNPLFPTTPVTLVEPSFADALREIDGASNLDPALKRHWCCSLRRICKLLGRAPDCTPARWTAIRKGVSALHHATEGNRAKTLQNHKANLRRALGWFAGDKEVSRHGVPLLPEWLVLREVIAQVGDARNLSGLMRYCAGRAISPADVDEAAIDDYMTYRAVTTRLPADAAARRKIARSWNRCLALDGWPQRSLAEPALKAAEGPGWPDFPVCLRADIEAYLESLTRLRRGKNGKRLRPCKASTIRTRRAELVAVVKMAARIVPLCELTGLKTLLKPGLVERVLEAYWQKNGERPSRFTIDLAWKLRSVAITIGADAEDVEQLGELLAAVEEHRQAGLTSKNLALIRRIFSGEVWRSVVNLPAVLIKEAERLQDHAPVKAAVTAQIAVAIAILSLAPVRLGNLGSIRLGENLIKPGGLKHPYWLVFPNYDVKNDIDLHFELDARTGELIDRYVEDFRPAVIRGSNEPWLFPGAKRGRKGLTLLSTQITVRIESATGLRMTTHQFRHAAAAILLKARPGEYELVRRLLGHRNIETTKNFYCGLETTQASEIFADIIRRHIVPEGEDD